MKCPYCGSSELKVTDSRNAVDANAIRRRRECLDCSRRFTTFEMVELTIQVKKRDGVYQDFQEPKLIQGLEAACRHTSVSLEQVKMIASKVTSELMGMPTREISSKEIGEIVMKYLKSMDTIAYIRFACVYRRFKDIGELMEAIHSVTPKGEKDVVEKF
ncbi:MAG: Transcriptional repressor NrdR [Chlamydiales bacterium]|nr:Transcriptional repressor NrdR [Chlamydiales bacterium]MCH9635623.1 Transcriptional repressor NrdR [Chlamydiales bacterium]MCH9703298.1 transcriptional regulator NrdR [Chlamydiota bacterium]